MSYSKSTYRKDFDERIEALLSEARRAQQLDVSLREIRDMVFQCAIFQTSAAMESYLKFILEGWIQSVKNHGRGDKIPHASRARYLAREIGPSFESYISGGAEGKFFKSLESKSTLWDFMGGSQIVPQYVNGVFLHEKIAYPSNRNLKRLFVRVGIDNIHDEVSRILKRDSESLIEGFQSVRTNLAHSAPGQITLSDVRRLLSDIGDFVRAADRILYRHIIRHGGAVCWA